MKMRPSVPSKLKAAAKFPATHIAPSAKRVVTHHSRVPTVLVVGLALSAVPDIVDFYAPSAKPSQQGVTACVVTTDGKDRQLKPGESGVFKYRTEDGSRTFRFTCPKK